ncbi:MAG: uncharacterized protein JWM10_2175, partial [Myxococcaceae bacterium]|nr:uncharacterized protein [Myxococcaceae bacterium]
MSRREFRAIALVPMVMLAALAGCSEDSVVGGDLDSGAPDAADDLGVVVDAGSLDTGAPDAPMDAPPPDRGPLRCGADGDCLGNAAGPVCDVASGMCIGCRLSPDTCPGDQHCDGASTRCVSGCHNDDGCRSGDAGVGGQRCDTNTHSCVQCVTDEHCPTGNLCVGNLCVTGCTDTRGCPGGQTCCGGGCVDTTTNLANCARCDNRCTAVNATPACRNSMCTIGACTSPFGDCDSMAANGCETNTFTDVFHCGGCGRACEARAHSTAACNAGTCAYTCETGYSDCDGNPSNGCETNSASDLANCGRCGAACMPPGAVGACVMGQCTVMACNEGFGNCDSNPSNGCEVDLSNATANCGTCGMRCTGQTNAAPTCFAGTCRTFCLPGFLECDGNPATGCEVNPTTDVNNCGLCNTRCATANGTPACAAGNCAIGSCNTGFANCNAAVGDGCEVNLQSDPTNCGTCGMVCPVAANQLPTCTAATCGAVCAPTYVDLDGQIGNGCECRNTDPDLPDDGFADTNCDGVDGVASRAIFVSTGGSNGNPGTRAAPKRDIQNAINTAASAGFSVFIAAGTYNESLTLAPGVSLYGGYNASNWSRGAGNVVIVEGTSATAVSAANLSASVELQRLTIRAAAAGGTGQSSYGVRVVNSASSVVVTLRSCSVTARAGSNGGGGSNGAAGGGGSNGAGGGNG